MDLKWEKCCDHCGVVHFNESLSFLQVARTFIKAWMSLNFDQIPSPTTELASLERLKNVMYNVVTML